jgi:starvation-inducible DNA-binding protein
MDLRFQVKHAAWNVKGHVFVQLRALFETIACELDTHMDRLASRITVLGGVVQGTVCTAATQSTLPAYPGDLVTGDAHVLAVTERVAQYATAIRAALEHATNVEDGATTNIYIKLSCDIETQLSLLETYLNQ